MKNFILKGIALFLFSFITISCSNEDDNEKLALNITSNTTEKNVKITFTSIEINGNITSSVREEIISRGVSWGTTPHPTINENKVEESNNTFTSKIRGLAPNTLYYFRVYASSKAETVYGPELVFSTSNWDGTKWDFYFNHDPPHQTWHADVTFNIDGTTVYHDATSPSDTYLIYGTWMITRDRLLYDLESDIKDNNDFHFTGTFTGNTLSGTYTYGVENDKEWTAILLPKS